MKTIAIEEIPGILGRRGPPTKYPYEQWKALPVGRAVAVAVNGAVSWQTALTIRRYMKKHYPGLTAVARGETVYVARVAEDKGGDA